MKVSVIIPCYNHGEYLQEAIESIKNIETSYSYEVMIVNDGSTDQQTIQKLAELRAEGYVILNQTNQGLAAARNNGIKASVGEYIIPLDSDNKLHTNYLTKAIDILEGDDKVDVLYGNRKLFGTESEELHTGKFDIVRLLNSNYIDACAVFRRSVWQKTSGYDGAMPGMGNEDWEFYINAFFCGSNFYYLDELCFYYRVTPASMRVTITKDKRFENKEYIVKKHAFHFYNFYKGNYKKLNYIKSNKFKASINLMLGRVAL